jgi:hypothetical protein
LAGLGVCNPTFSELQLGNTSERFDTKGLWKNTNNSVTLKKTKWQNQRMCVSV